MGSFESKNKNVHIPWSLTTHSRQEWIAWRDRYLLYMNEKSIPPYKQGEHFFEFIGNIGNEISKNFYYYSASQQSDVDTLLFKFDVYFIFGGRKRHGDESIEDYVKALKDVAEKTAKRNTEKVIKEKLLQDLVSDNAFVRFSELVPAFSKVSNYESLALHELMFIWEQIRKPANLKDFNIPREPNTRDTLKYIDKRDVCFRCDLRHNGSQCPAYGQKCWKCDGYNHFAKCCLKTFIRDCTSCGLHHIQNKCPAFAKQCSRCEKMNHFPWQCFAQMTLLCTYCGQSHLSNIQKCPAKDNTCSKCHRVGHYSFTCRSRKK